MQGQRNFDPAQLPSRMAEKIVLDEDGCWVWTGVISTSGYGTLTFQAHRLTYALLTGDFAEGLDLDHLCRVRRCVNPAHLEPVTRRENLRRGIGLTAQFIATTHCPQGHEYTPENTHVNQGSRICKACRRDRERKKYQRDRVAAAARRKRQRLTQRTREGLLHAASGDPARTLCGAPLLGRPTGVGAAVTCQRCLRSIARLARLQQPRECAGVPDIESA